MQAEFVEASGRRLFVMLRTPSAPSGECMLVVPPFAEEMNKSRRMITMLAQRSCREGKALLSVDLSGTGDSDGEFAEARVGHWIDDLACAMAWSAARGWRVTSVLGIRLGAILAGALVKQRGTEFSRAVFWQPVTSGSRHIDQFLRLRVMASRMENDASESVAGLRNRLNAGETVEVAGYKLSGELCAEIDALDLLPQLAPPFPPIHWLEVVADPAAQISPGTARTIEAARSAGSKIYHAQMACEPFWMSTEVVVCRELVAAT